MRAGVSFQTRARTIDHLGRGQIADCPTAISELWKNAYDAYAKNVELQIFDGDLKVAAIFDDGFGMSRQDFIERWLVIGTESKIETISLKKSDQFGLMDRPRQGEKGIGRLSAAFLAPVNLIVSKKKNHGFAAAMVDWRLFENPFLALEDIHLPVEEFDEPQEVFELIPKMLALLADNVRAKSGPEERRLRLQQGWKRYSDYEKAQGVSQTVSEKILDFSAKAELSDRHFTEWPVFLGLADHGTALYMLEVHRELAVWVDPEVQDEDDEVKTVKTALKRTLTGFIDPYAVSDHGFSYSVRVNMGNRHTSVLSSEESFKIEDLRTLEHVMEGEFDGNGVFKGRVRVFGKDRGECVFVPSRVTPKKGPDKLGAFSFCIGTYEQELRSSTHTQERHAFLDGLTEKFSGLAVYRDGLRVMPYGRPEADFFGIEERRTKNAGREFWVHRRSFGRVAFTREENPNLRDKAGREGLVDNRARREMQLLVQNVLMQAARRYFGSDSDIRDIELPEIQRSNELAKEAAETARKNKRRGFKKFLRENHAKLVLALEDAKRFSGGLNLKEGGLDETEVALLVDNYSKYLDLKEDLRLPPKPAKIGDDEDAYRKYRDAYKELLAVLDSVSKSIASASERIQNTNPETILEKHLNSNQARLADHLGKIWKLIKEGIDELRAQWFSKIDEDRGRYYQIARPLIADLEKGSRLSKLMNLMDAHYHELEQQYDLRYSPFLRTLEQLKKEIDLDGAFNAAEDERAVLEEKIGNFYSLAQLGISVEIIGHELNTLDGEVGRNLKRLPNETQKLEAFRLAYEAHRALVERLRFLAPLKLAGYRQRQDITGKEIANYIENFFLQQFRNSRISFLATDAFKNLVVSDLPSRIFPVFINLVNNALYWLNFAASRQLVLDFIDGKVVVADSGPGVDTDDIGKLFELFFTRRAKGRGVGLYLCRVNLAVARHVIRYANDADPKILKGANFIIEFKGIAHE